MCGDIGIALEDNSPVDHIFHFFYNVHCKMRKESDEDPESSKFAGTNFEIYDEFSRLNLQKFLIDQVGSQLVYFFVKNYSDSYMQHLSKTFKKAEGSIESISKFIKLTESS